MTELKTLKDLEISSDPVIIKNGVLVSGGTGKIEVRDLKQEAIKWVKYYQPQEDEDMSTYDTCNLKVVEFIREFFNIIEEDLK